MSAVEELTTRWQGYLIACATMTWIGTQETLEVCVPITKVVIFGLGFVTHAGDHAAINRIIAALTLIHEFEFIAAGTAIEIVYQIDQRSNILFEKDGLLDELGFNCGNPRSTSDGYSEINDATAVISFSPGADIMRLGNDLTLGRKIPAAIFCRSPYMDLPHLRNDGYYTMVKSLRDGLKRSPHYFYEVQYGSIFHNYYDVKDYMKLYLRWDPSKPLLDTVPQYPKMISKVLNNSSLGKHLAPTG